jgi:hypothetical protein
MTVDIKNESVPAILARLVKKREALTGEAKIQWLQGLMRTG